MNASGNEALNAVLQKDYEVNVEKYFRRGWEVLKECFPQMIGYMLGLVLINVVLAFIPILGSMAASLLSGPLAAGYTFVVLAILRGKSFTFNDFFKGLTNKYFLQLFLLSLVGGIFIGLGFLLLILPGIFLAVCYTFAIQFAVDWDLEFFDALETSRKFVMKQWLQVFILVLALGVLNFIGILMLGVGVLVTAPLGICIAIAAYDDLAGNRANGSTREG